METVLSNVKEAMTYINKEEINVDKNVFIKHLKSRLQETLTINHIIADQLISKNNRGCNIDVEVSFNSLALSKPNDFNLTTFIQKQIENFDKSLKPIRSRPHTFTPEKPDTSWWRSILSIVHLIKNPLFTDWWNLTNHFARLWFSIFKVTSSPGVNDQIRIKVRTIYERIDEIAIVERWHTN